MESKPFKHRTYHMNPIVKEKVKDIDKMLVAGMIFSVDEVEWINDTII
jgi:hypothetical protein